MLVGIIRCTPAQFVTATVGGLMVRPTPSVHAADSLMTVARKLRAHATDAVVVHADQHAFVGMVTRADIIDQCVADGGDPATMTAESLITDPCPFVRPDQDAGSTVIEAILRHHASFLPVVDDGRLVGIITLDAIAAHLVDSMADLGVDLDDIADSEPGTASGTEVVAVPDFVPPASATVGVRGLPNL